MRRLRTFEDSGGGGGRRSRRRNLEEEEEEVERLRVRSFEEFISKAAH